MPPTSPAIPSADPPGAAPAAVPRRATVAIKVADVAVEPPDATRRAAVRLGVAPPRQAGSWLELLEGGVPAPGFRRHSRDLLYRVWTELVDRQLAPQRRLWNSLIAALQAAMESTDPLLPHLLDASHCAGYHLRIEFLDASVYRHRSRLARE